MNNLFLPLITLFCLLAFDVYPQSNMSEWIGGGDRLDQLNDAAENVWGEVAVVGTTHSNTFSDDIFFMIFDRDGIEITRRRIGGISAEQGIKIVNTPDGNFIIMVARKIDNTDPSGINRTHGLLIKIDRKGKLIWQKPLGFLEIIDIVSMERNLLLLKKESDGNFFLGMYDHRGKSISSHAIKLPGSYPQITPQAICSTEDEIYVLATVEDASGYKIIEITYDHNLAYRQHITSPQPIKEIEITSVTSARGKRYLTGEVKDLSNRRTQAMIGVFDGAAFKSVLFGKNYSDRANAISAAPDGLLWVAGSTTEKRFTQATIHAFDEDLNIIEQSEVGGKKNDAGIFITDILNGNLLVGGINSSESRGLDMGDMWLQTIPRDYSKKCQQVPEIDITNFEVDSSSTDLIYLIKAVLSVSESDCIRFDSLLVTLHHGDSIYKSMVIPTGSISSSGITKITIPIQPSEEMRRAADSLSLRISSFSNNNEFVDVKLPMSPVKEAILEGWADSNVEAILVDTPNTIRILWHLTNKGTSSTEPLTWTATFSKELEPTSHSESMLGKLKPGDITTLILNSIPVHLGIDDSQTVYVAIFDQEKMVLLDTLQLDISVPMHQIREAVRAIHMVEIPDAGADDEVTISISDVDHEEQPVLPPKPNEFFQFISWVDPAPESKFDDLHTTDLYTYSVILNVISKTEVDPEQLMLFLDGDPATENGHHFTLPTISGGEQASGYYYTYRHKIPLAEGDNHIRLRLINQWGDTTWSDKMIIHYDPPRSNLFVYTFGVPHDDLPFTSKDAEDFASSFKGQEGLLYNKVSIRSFNTPEETTIEALRKAIINIEKDYWRFKRIKDKDVIILYYSSHGFTYGSGNKEFRIAASDFEFGYEELYSLAFEQEVVQRLERINCKVLLFVDACYSGDIAYINEPVGIKGDLSDFDLEISKAIGTLANTYEDVYFFLSCSPGERSYTDKAWGNSAFTKSLLEAFRNVPGEVDERKVKANADGNSILTLGELYKYSRDRVPEIVKTKKIISTMQTPFMPQLGELKDMPLMVVDERQRVNGER